MEEANFPENGTKAEQAKFMAANSDFGQSATAIAFCIDASPDYVREVLNE